MATVQILTLGFDLILFLFIVYYLLKLRRKERELDKKSEKLDANYHHVVDEALAKERQIVDDATQQADKIITDTKYVTDSSKQNLDTALKQMVSGMQQETLHTTQNFAQTYQTSLQQIAANSLTDFQKTIKDLQADLHQQVQSFHSTVLPNLEKELDEYKKARMKQVDDTSMRVVQKASQEILNKTMSLDDHQKLVIDSLERAKKEGLFN